MIRQFVVISLLFVGGIQAAEPETWGKMADPETGLNWTLLKGHYNWEEAKTRCEGLGKDVSLPKREDVLSSLPRLRASEFSKHFPGFRSIVWTSEQTSGAPFPKAWAVYYNTSNMATVNQISSLGVLCRHGKSLAELPPKVKATWEDPETKYEWKVLTPGMRWDLGVKKCKELGEGYRMASRNEFTGSLGRIFGTEAYRKIKSLHRLVWTSEEVGKAKAMAVFLDTGNLMSAQKMNAFIVPCVLVD